MIDRFSWPARHQIIATLLALGIGAVIIVVYAPVTHAQFIWTDITDFQDAAWLRHGRDWLHFLLRDFNGWTNYFRPFVIALFTLEVRTFDAQPGPMHAVSLAMHLFNTALVGVLAVLIHRQQALLKPRATNVFAISSLLYGLHPLLIEPVAWIGCQFDLAVTAFMLLGVIIHLHFKSRWRRALGVAFCFFFAALSKESAIAFPLIIAVFDWFSPSFERSPMARFRSILRRQWLIYVLLAAVGVVYLLLRHWALGSLQPAATGDEMASFTRWQRACFLYLRYGLMFFLPARGMGPIHPYAVQSFAAATTVSLATDVAAMAIFFSGVFLTLRRRYTGALMLVVTFTLLPVLHIVPAHVDDSLFHDRYAMSGLAFACAWIPTILRSVKLPAASVRIAPWCAYGTLVAWLILSIVMIRQVLPLWSTQRNLWEWAVYQYPASVQAKDQLLDAYIDENDYRRAWPLISGLAADPEACINCMINAASLAIWQQDPQRASLLLNRIAHSPTLAQNPPMLQAYLTARSKVLLIQGHPDQAEQAARQAIGIDALKPDPRMVLAEALLLQGKRIEAHQAESAALMLLPPDQRDLFEKTFDKLEKAPTLEH